jgi:hypothetical protein
VAYLYIPPRRCADSRSKNSTAGSPSRAAPPSATSRPSDCPGPAPIRGRGESPGTRPRRSLSGDDPRPSPAPTWGDELGPGRTIGRRAGAHGATPSLRAASPRSDAWRAGQPAPRGRRGRCSRPGAPRGPRGGRPPRSRARLPGGSTGSGWGHPSAREAGVGRRELLPTTGRGRTVPPPPRCRGSGGAESGYRTRSMTSADSPAA